MMVVRKKDEAERLREFLCEKGFATAVYHGSLSVGGRETG